MEKSLFGVVFRLSHDCTHHRSGRAGDDAAHSGMLDNTAWSLARAALAFSACGPVPQDWTSNIDFFHCCMICTSLRKYEKDASIFIFIIAC